MKMFDRADAYLAIPPAYSERYGSLRWSHQRDAIERKNGSALVIVEELLGILEGVFSKPPLAPFPYVLALIHQMKKGEAGEFARLHRAFQAANGTSGRGRNSGLLISELCRSLPHTEQVIDWEEINLAVMCLRFNSMSHRVEPVKMPSLTPAEFESLVGRALVAIDDAALVHWFKFGCAPNHSGEQLAKQEESLATRVKRLLQLARKSPRLVGALALVPVLDGALTLPPRRRTSESVPQGGYCDVTTKGNLEQLLPSQFALGVDEFVRRFASNELLYFKREEPHKTQRPNRTIVLDLGVRTWGNVRLALAGAAFSLLGRDPRQYGSTELFLTSLDHALDLQGQPAASVLESLESSDLILNPANCLTRALKANVDKPTLRDVILLTHPRNLGERAVLSAAEARQAGDRLFAATVDERGRAELSIWTGSGPISVKSFRLDLGAVEKTPVESSVTPSTSKRYQEWSGDIEPVPFPFRAGLAALSQQLAFDADGAWLVAASREGLLQRIPLDGSRSEMLPRACVKGRVLRDVTTILGVTGGVVVCGRMTAPTTKMTITKTNTDGHILTADATSPVLPPHAEYFVAAHYDWVLQRVTLHFLYPADPSMGFWAAYPNLDCIVVRTSSNPKGGPGVALDLTTRGRFPSSLQSELTSRAKLAWEQSEHGGSPPHVLSTMPSSMGWHLTQKGNELHVQNQSVKWKLTNLLEDGKPFLEGAVIHSAQLAGDVLSVALSRRGERLLALFRGPTGSVLGQLKHSYRHVHALSQDGRFLAHRNSEQAVVISDTSAPAAPLVSVPRRINFHNNLEVRLRGSGEQLQLIVAIGTYGHTFRLFAGRLRYSLALGWDKFPDPKGTSARCTLVDYDHTRFPKSEVAATPPWTAVVDRLGQVVLLANNELVATIAVCRQRVAVWAPGGVFWGDPELIGGPPTPEAEVKIGRAIMAAHLRSAGA